jgi:hypothetical protein
MSHQGTKKRRQARRRTTIKERYSADRHGPREEEDECQRRIHDSQERAEIFKYIVTVRRNNVLLIASL